MSVSKEKCGCLRSQRLRRHTRFLNFAFEYLRENEKVRETVFSKLQNLLNLFSCLPSLRYIKNYFSQLSQAKHELVTYVLKLKR